jgi:hypothetical protein
LTSYAEQVESVRSASNRPFSPDWDGTVMEQRGRNRWQTFGAPPGRKWLDLGRTVATGCHRLPFGSHGKEGVDGSSPSEGSAKSPAQRRFLVRTQLLRSRGYVAVGERPEAVRGEHAERHRKDGRQIRPNSPGSNCANEEQNEQARRDRAGGLNRDVVKPGPRRIASGKRPAAVEDVAIDGSDGERKRGSEHVPRPEREQEPVDDEAEHRIPDADDQEARELRRGVMPPERPATQSLGQAPT